MNDRARLRQAQKRQREKERRIVVHGAIVRENLPFPFVVYPNHYGTFIGFSENEKLDQVFLCECERLPFENYLRLHGNNRSLNANELRMAPLDSFYFPDHFARLSLTKTPDEAVNFQSNLCHKCNSSVPSMIYCHPMYGGTFKQKYGWYINQTCFRLGVGSHGYQFIEDVCSPELANQITHALHLRENAENFGTEPLREIDKIFENVTREEFGVRVIGEAWVNETLLSNIVKKIFDGNDVIRHHRPEWLEGLELDVFVPNFQLAFEYQGQQHFKPIKAWGGEEALSRLKERDNKKRQLCELNSIRLIAVDYDEPLTEEHIRARIEQS